MFGVFVFCEHCYSLQFLHGSLKSAGASGVLDGLAMATRGRGARLLAAATLCHLIQRGLIQDPQQLSLLVDTSVVEAMAAILNTPGWEELAGSGRERAKPVDVNLSVVTGPELAVSALSELAALPDGCCTLPRSSASSCIVLWFLIREAARRVVDTRVYLANSPCMTIPKSRFQVRDAFYLYTQSPKRFKNSIMLTTLT